VKKQLLYIFILFSLYSCKGQTESNLKIDVSKVKEITIINKVYSCYRNYKKETVIIKDKDQIEKIIDAFTYSEPIKGNINEKSSNGFFEINFYEGDKNHYYTLNYTIYDGVILRNDNNGDRYRNDRLEIAIYKHFVNY